MVAVTHPLNVVWIYAGSAVADVMDFPATAVWMRETRLRASGQAVNIERGGSVTYCGIFALTAQSACPQMTAGGGTDDNFGFNTGCEGC
jgi:hypothetical protein